MTKSVLFLLIGIGVIFVLYSFFRPQPIVEQPIDTPNATQAPIQAKKMSPNVLVLENGKLVSGPEIVTVTEGDTVTFEITADADEEFHLHGYDKIVTLEAGVTQTLSFQADITGRFPYELEQAGSEIGVLEVSPKE